ncbi:uncharacterized protein LOC135819195 [Sycon ciliatum]|uniref:uncharacterized protein LOC135819195 n=1 Tax=Sycon ciliatum TaxID=27933 RepID=UPI0031F71F90
MKWCEQSATVLATCRTLVVLCMLVACADVTLARDCNMISQGCSWRTNILVVKKGCVPMRRFQLSYQDVVFERINATGLDTANPEECLLRCQELSARNDWAALHTETCWCSDSRSVREADAPTFDYHLELCQPMDRCERGDRFWCGARAGFYTFNHTLQDTEPYLRSQSAIVQVNGTERTGQRADIGMGTPVTLTCQLPSPPVAGVDYHWTVDGVPLGELLNSSRCQEFADSPTVPIVTEADGGAVLQIASFSSCLTGVYKCMVKSQVICSSSFGCAQAASMLLLAVNVPGKSAMPIAILVGVIVGAALGMLLLLLALLLVRRATRRWDPSTTGPAHREAAASAGDGGGNSSGKSTSTEGLAVMQTEGDAGARTGAQKKSFRQRILSLESLRHFQKELHPSSNHDDSGKGDPHYDQTSDETDIKHGKKKKKKVKARELEMPMPVGDQGGVTLAPPKPLRKGKTADQDVPPGYSAVGMSQPASTTLTTTQHQVPDQDHNPNANAYAISSVKSRQGTISDQYSVIQKNPSAEADVAEPPAEQESPGQPLPEQYPESKRLNYIDIELTPTPRADKTAEEGILASPSKQQVCYSALIPEAHLKGVRRGSDGLVRGN